MPEHAVLKPQGLYSLQDLFGREIICAFSRLKCGNMSLSYADTNCSLGNRRLFLNNLGIDYRRLVCAKQVHASQIRSVKEQDAGRGALDLTTCFADTDAFITDARNLPIAVFTADCLSVFLYDPSRPATGLIHAGWRGIKEDILEKTLRLMQKEFGTKSADLYVGLGPCIRSCCYEVGREFVEIFPEGLIRRSNRSYLDIAGISKNRLLDLGLSESKIFDSGICTCCRPEEYFSFRRQGKDSGRMMSVTMLK